MSSVRLVGLLFIKRLERSMISLTLVKLLIFSRFLMFMRLVRLPRLLMLLKFES